MATMYKNTWELGTPLERTLPSHCRFLSGGRASAETHSRQSGGVLGKEVRASWLTVPMENCHGGGHTTHTDTHKNLSTYQPHVGFMSERQ